MNKFGTSIPSRNRICDRINLKGWDNKIIDLKWYEKMSDPTAGTDRSS